MEVAKNLERRRYETQIDGHWAFIEYLKAKNGIYLTHTEAPPVLEGRGRRDFLG